ncbi:Piriformospora indica-insensitive protein 2 [Heracleum sosnowskyi]|uniref:Piriformospora indica-insensitive protein 2 n=1 Tax=Heracleum sosnowskyi TaxID=360622 RepID=A0AAD8MUE7_9APIA|nr:Piriformospora indica-insensitive protein 2 [Heracleum sosnowskyi]
MKHLIKSRATCMVLVFILYLRVEYCNGEEDKTLGAVMEKTEQEALYFAIQGFVGKWWNGSELYPDPCGWTPIQGVSCDIFDGGYWFVTELNIGLIHENSPSCVLKVEFSPHLFALKHLKRLSFVNCMVHRSHPITIPTEDWAAFAGSLESLEFRSNPGLIGHIPITFGSLTNLQSLVFLENKMSGELPTNLGNLINLKRLVFSGNQFTGQVPSNFGSLRQLLIMDLSRNSLSGNLPSTFGRLNSLLKLDVSNNRLEGTVPNEIGNLRNLTLLDLSRNKFAGALTKSLQELSSLKELVLSKNSISGSLMNLEWHNLQNLIILDLSKMMLKGEVPESISELKGLRFLGLNDNKLTGELTPKLAEMPNVTAMYLNGNNFTGKLILPESFYGKMGRRFGAWDNPNLCYSMNLSSTRHVPFGVKQCQDRVNLYGTEVDISSKLEGNVNEVPSLVASGEYTRNGISYVYLVNMMMLLCFLDFAI